MLKLSAGREVVNLDPSISFSNLANLQGSQLFRQNQGVEKLL